LKPAAVPTKGLANGQRLWKAGVMFLRHKIRRKDGKQHRYWSIVENRRVSGGRTEQRHVLYLGEINDSQRAAWCRRSKRSTRTGRPVNKSRCFPRIVRRHRWSATWCRSGSAACACADRDNGVAVGWRAICGISLSWMSSGRRACRRHDKERAG
jgi:hypothetical protein